MHVAVIGGGIIGTLSAYYLQQAGCSVTVCESDTQIADGTSGMNGGQLSYAYVSPLGNPGVFSLAARAAFGNLEDVKVTRWLDPQLWHWGACLLLRESSQRRYEANQAQLLELTVRSRALMEKFLAAHPVEFHRSTAGKMHLYVSEKQLAAAQRFSAELATYGFRQRFLSPQDCAALEPSLAGRTGALAGGMFSQDDESGDCALFARAVQQCLQGKDVTFLTATPVARISFAKGRATGIVTTAGETIAADAVLVCAGASSHALLKTAGIVLPLYPIKGYSAEFSLPEEALRHSVTDHLRRVVFAPMGDTVRVAGLMHFSGMDTGISDATRQYLAQIITDVFPQADIGTLHVRSGLRPYLPASRPLIGPTRHPGLFVNVGHAMLGWTLAHAACAQAAACIAPAS